MYIKLKNKTHRPQTQEVKAVPPNLTPCSWEEPQTRRDAKHARNLKAPSPDAQQKGNVPGRQKTSSETN